MASVQREAGLGEEVFLGGGEWLEGLKRPVALIQRPRLAASPRDPGPGWESSSRSGGFSIAANHRRIKMFTGRGGINCQRMILMLLFLPRPRSLCLGHQSVMEPFFYGVGGECVRFCISVLFILFFNFFLMQRKQIFSDEDKETVREVK